MCASDGEMRFSVYAGALETCISRYEKYVLWLFVRSCRWMSWLLVSFDICKSFPMRLAGDRSMCLTCVYLSVCLSPGA